ncbi:MAG: DUF2520 domain-containing protein [Flavobacteriaceae bacterium]|nr:DUF2520 domain-containing protein [Flavobacteriaceae bacterium]
MIKVVVLGFGNVGKHLVDAFLESDEIDLVQVYNRSRPKQFSTTPLEFTTDISEIKKADIHIVAIPDDDIASFSEEIPLENSLVVHTSGSVPMQELNTKNRQGVFYPLQTFTANRSVEFKEIPICVEAQNKEDLIVLLKLASAVSNNVQEINSEERRSLHLAAVFINNFVNHLYHISEEIVNQTNLNFNLLKPLLLETASKVINNSPKDVQTGPAKRNDQETIKKHLALLENKKYRKIYKAITKSITATYGKEL